MVVRYAPGNPIKPPLSSEPCTRNSRKTRVPSYRQPSGIPLHHDSHIVLPNVPSARPPRVPYCNVAKQSPANPQYGTKPLGLRSSLRPTIVVSPIASCFSFHTRITGIQISKCIRNLWDRTFQFHTQTVVFAFRMTEIPIKIEFCGVRPVLGRLQPPSKYEKSRHTSAMSMTEPSVVANLPAAILVQLSFGFVNSTTRS